MFIFDFFFILLGTTLQLRTTSLCWPCSRPSETLRPPLRGLHDVPPTTVFSWRTSSWPRGFYHCEKAHRATKKYRPPAQKPSYGIVKRDLTETSQQPDPKKTASRVRAVSFRLIIQTPGRVQRHHRQHGFGRCCDGEKLEGRNMGLSIEGDEVLISGKKRRHGSYKYDGQGEDCLFELGQLHGRSILQVWRPPISSLRGSHAFADAS